MSTVKLVINGLTDEVDLTKYLDVEAGRGMEPGDPHFTNKVFAHSLLKPGGTLALEDLQLKEMLFPLKLKAKTKPELATLVQRINRILTAPGTQVEWQDEGASTITYFDLATGQFDDEYDYRVGVNNWLKGKLRLFCQPLGFNESGRAGAAQLVNGKATTLAMGSMPIVSFPVATAVPGDAAALLGGTVSASQNTAVFAGFAAMSVLPVGSYVTTWPVPSGTTEGTAIATQNSLGGSFLRMPSEPVTGHVIWTIPSLAYQYAGEQRVLAVARAGSPTVLTFLFGTYLSSIEFKSVATISGAGEGWTVFDMGVVAIPSLAISKSEHHLRLEKSSGKVTNGFDVAGLLLLPESSTVWVHPREPENHDVTFDPVANAIYSPGRPQAPEYNDLTSLARGAMPTLRPGEAEPPTIAFMYMPNGGQLNVGLHCNVNVVARTRYIF